MCGLTAIYGSDFNIIQAQYNRNCYGVAEELLMNGCIVISELLLTIPTVANRSSRPLILVYSHANIVFASGYWRTQSLQQ